MKAKTMKYFLSGLILLIAIFSKNMFGQDSSAFFACTYGDTLNDVARYAEVTSDGGFIITGFHTVPPDTTCNIWVLRTNSNGDTLWTTSLGTPNYDVGYCVKETSDSHFVVCGVWTDLDNYDPNDYSGDIFVSLLSPEGNVLWTWLYANGNTALNGGANYILEDIDGNFVLIGGMRHIGYNKKHAFLLKLNRSTQTVMWESIFPTEDYVSYTTTVLQTPADSGFIITGLIYPLNNGDCDIYLVKTNSVGDTLWTNTIGEWGDYEARHMAATSDGGYIITGNTAIPPSSNRIAYLLKVDEEGNYQWHKHFPSGYPNIPSSAFGIVQSPDSGYALTGYFPFIETNSQDLVLIKTYQNGDLLWMKGFGDDYYDKGYSITLSEEGFVLAGYKQESSGERDVFLIHTNFEGLITSNSDLLEHTIDKKLVISSFPNPARKLLNIVLDQRYLSIAIEIMDITGKIIIRKKIGNANYISINLENLVNGIYFICVQTDDKKDILKIVKEK